MAWIKTLKREENTKKIKFIALIVLFFFSPFFIYIQPFLYFSTFSEGKISLSLPHLVTGDEPHYLIMTSSIIKDFDLDVKNNYDNSLNGCGDAGFRWRNLPIDHHAYFVNTTKSIQIMTPEFNPDYYRPEEHKMDPDFKERSVRYPGLPFFSSIFLWPFRHSVNLDSFAVLLSAIISLVGFYFLYLILVYFKMDEHAALLVTIIFMFATQMWYYAKTFNTGPYIASFLIISYYFFIVKKKIIIPSILLGIIFFIIYPFIIFSIIFMFYKLREKKVKEFVLFSIPITIAVVLHLLYNSLIYRHIFFPQASTFVIYSGISNIIPGFLNFLFLPERSLFLFTPFLIFSFLGFYHFYKQEKKEAIFTFLLFFVSLLMFTVFKASWWGVNYATRYLTFIIPLLAMPLLFWYTANRSKVLKVVFFILVFISFVISIYSVFADPGCTYDHPPFFCTWSPWFL